MGVSKIVFMGTPRFAVPSLNALIEAGHRVLAAVTQPDKPQGRGMNTLASPVKQAALSHGIPVLEPLKLRDPEFIERLKSLGADFFVVVAFGKILPKSVLDIPPKGCVNVHASLLPFYRGAAPINWAIVNGETVSGVSTMLMDPGMDTGPVLLEKRVEIGPEETAEELAKRLSDAGAELLVETISRMNGGGITPRPQDESKATYAPILKKEDGEIDWNRTAREVKDLMRGLTPWPGAYTRWNGRTIKVHNGLASEGMTDKAPGTVVAATKDALRVACASGSVFEITELQPENKKRMSARDFVQGYRIAEGERFGE